MQPFLQVTLRKVSDGSVEIAPPRKVALARRPLPDLNAEYLLVAYQGERVLSATPVRFPGEGHSSTTRSGRLTHQEFTVASATINAFVEATEHIDRLDLLGPSGGTVLSVPGSELDALPIISPRPKYIDVRRTALTRDELATRYPEIQFLGPIDQPWISPELLADRTLVGISDEAAEAIGEALSRAAPLLASSAQRIAIAEWPKQNEEQRTIARETMAVHVRGTLLLNADHIGDPALLGTVLHELAHAFDLLTWAANDEPLLLMSWPAPVRAAARALIAKYRLTFALRSIWSELHASGFAEGYTREYIGEGWSNVSNEDARAGGVATSYGTRSAAEDLAEYVGTTEAPSGLEPGICPLFDGITEIAPKLAIPYAKLVLLRGVGAITDAAFDACVRQARLEPRPGIHFPGPNVSFTGELRAGLATSEGKRFFRVMANGVRTYQMLIEVALTAPDASPLGLHRLDDVWIATIASARHGIYLAHDLPERARAGERGLVLVMESTTERVSGAIFGLALQNGFGGITDRWPFGTFAAP